MGSLARAQHSCAHVKIATQPNKIKSEAWTVLSRSRTLEWNSHCGRNSPCVVQCLTAHNAAATHDSGGGRGYCAILDSIWTNRGRQHPEKKIAIDEAKEQKCANISSPANRSERLPSHIGPYASSSACQCILTFYLITTHAEDNIVWTGHARTVCLHACLCVGYPIIGVVHMLW